MSRKALRVLHLGYGPLGRRVVADLLAVEAGTLVAIVDPAPAATADKPPAPVLRSLDEVRNWNEIDCVVVTTSSGMRACESTFRALLERGQCVVSTCEELSYPWLRHAAMADELDALACKHGGRLLGTGINPGFLMDAFPAFAATVTKRVDAVRVYRWQDATPRRVPFQKKIGAGSTRADFEAGMKAGTHGHVGLGESLHLLASALGWTIDRWEEKWEPIMADADRLNGVYQVARGWEGATLRVELDFRAALGLKDPHDRVVFEGEPPLDVTWKGGVPGDIGTSAVVVRCLPRLRAAAPGLHTMVSIPIGERGR